MIKVSRFLLPAALGVVLGGPAASQEEQEQEMQRVNVAALGVTTRAPSVEEAEKLGLTVQVRTQGQIVTEVAEDGPAARAGIRSGDAILQLDDNGIFSQDDVADFLSVSKPDQKVAVRVVRASSEQETLSVSLGSRTVERPKGPRLEWQFASLAQLDAALEQAKKGDSLLLVGLSGAET